MDYNLRVDSRWQRPATCLLTNVVGAPTISCRLSTCMLTSANMAVILGAQFTALATDYCSRPYLHAEQIPDNDRASPCASATPLACRGAFCLAIGAGICCIRQISTASYDRPSVD